MLGQRPAGSHVLCYSQEKAEQTASSVEHTGPCALASWFFFFFLDVAQPSSSQEHHSMVNKHQPVPVTLQRSWNLWLAVPCTWVKSNQVGLPCASGHRLQGDGPGCRNETYSLESPSMTVLATALLL